MPGHRSRLRRAAAVGGGEVSNAGRQHAHEGSTSICGEPTTKENSRNGEARCRRRRTGHSQRQRVTRTRPHPALTQHTHPPSAKEMPLRVQSQTQPEHKKKTKQAARAAPAAQLLAYLGTCAAAARVRCFSGPLGTTRKVLWRWIVARGAMRAAARANSTLPTRRPRPSASSRRTWVRMMAMPPTTTTFRRGGHRAARRRAIGTPSTVAGCVVTRRLRLR